MTKSCEEVTVVYQAWDAWCTSMGLREKMDRCVAYLKNNLFGTCLNRAFVIFPGGPTPPKSKVHGTTFHSMQSEENDWVNPHLVLGSWFWGKKQVNKQMML